jgi:VanZ family protein
MDKVKHFVVGFALALVVTLVTGNPNLGALVACLAGVAKEVYDAYTPGRVEMLDFIATAAGGVAAWLVLS